MGAQGGSLEDVTHFGKNNDIGLLVNASRAIIFASSQENYAEEAQKQAAQYASEMKALLV